MRAALAVALSAGPALADDPGLPAGGPNGGLLRHERVTRGGVPATLRVNDPPGSAPSLTLGGRRLGLSGEAALNYGGLACVEAGGGTHVGLGVSQGNAFEWFLLFDPATLAMREIAYEEAVALGWKSAP